MKPKYLSCPRTWSLTFHVYTTHANGLRHCGQCKWMSMYSCTSKCVFVYSFIDINMGQWLSVYRGGNDSVDNHTVKSDTTRWLFFFFCILEVATIDEYVLAASALICAAFDWKCYSRVCTDICLCKGLSLITKKWGMVLTSLSRADDICLLRCLINFKTKRG